MIVGPGKELLVIIFDFTREVSVVTAIYLDQTKKHAAKEINPRVVCAYCEHGVKDQAEFSHDRGTRIHELL